MIVFSTKNRVLAIGGWLDSRQLADLNGSASGGWGVWSLAGNLVSRDESFNPIVQQPMPDSVPASGLPFRPLYPD